MSWPLSTNRDTYADTHTDTYAYKDRCFGKSD